VKLFADEPFVDPDPWPRAASVGDGSAFAAVSAAVAAPVHSVEVATAGASAVETVPDRRVTPLTTWRFSADPSAPATEPVTAPDAWSRRDPGLADFRGPAVYERSVTAAGPFARVVFEGLDYLATVSVDGQRRALHEGGFTLVAVDVPGGAESVVRVELDDPVEPHMLEVDPLLRPKRKVKGVAELHDSRPGGMAIGSHFDPERWGVRWGTGGLAGPAWLHETGVFRIDATFVTAVPGELRLSWVITNLGDAAVDAEVVAAVATDVGLVVRTHLAVGANRVSIRLRSEGEEHWSPEHPALYRLRSAVRAAGEAGEVSDAHEVTFGFRSVDMPIEGPEQFHLRVNGSRVYVRAANYIPGVWPSELPASIVARDVELATRAGLNSLGVHAGVCAPLPALADEAGVLVYQDFPLQWSYDADAGPLVDGGPTFAEASTWLAAELVYRFYNHPSVVYWCGHNEPAYQLREAFGTVNVPELLGLVETMDACPDESALDERRAEVFRHVDPSRPASAVSGLGASRPFGDHHDYCGSLSGGSATDAGAGSVAFVSEYGAWSANFSAALDVPAAAGDWPPPADTEPDWYVRTHLYSTQVTYAGRPTRFPDFPTWCFAGQLWAGWHAKVVTEKARLNKWQPSGAQRYHFFVDHWGEAGAGMVDRHRTTGPGYRGLAAANRPLVALAPFPRGARVAPGAEVRLPIVVLNDLSHPAGPGGPGGPVQLRWRLARLGPDDCFLVGRDDPERPGPLQGELAPSDQCCVLPRGEGVTLLEGECSLEVPADARIEAAEVVWTADTGGAGHNDNDDAAPIALFLDLDGVAGWTSFMVAPDGWSPQPGLVGQSRFTVTSDRPGPLRRRWTGDVVDPSAAPPDQYLLGDLPVDVYDDVHIHADGRVTTKPLPW
jgi:beta-mannosidase